ncbi:MAG: HAD family hydrolase [Saccharopolyspora rectivirgula]
MRKPGLVASDMDGTLLDPVERVRPRTARAARRVVASGTPLILVTGRPPRWMPEVFDALGAPGLAVCANGAVLYDAATDRVLHSRSIDPVTLHDVVVELRRELPGCAFGVERATGAVGGRYSGRFQAESQFQHLWDPSEVNVTGLAELTGKAAVKLLVLHQQMTSEEMAAVAREVVGDQLQVTFSTGSGLLELSAPGVDKASGLATVADHLGVDRDDVITFGDMPNDVPMLRWAGHGVAMRNSHPEALAAADEVTGTNREDGVAQVLERWW